MGPGSPETTVVRQRYGIPTARPYRRVGTALHRTSKLMTGAYIRQFRGRPLRGRDLRWFRKDVGTVAFLELLDRCYGVRRDPAAHGGVR